MKLQTLKLNEDQDLTDADSLEARLPDGFFARHFHIEPTARQQKFDWAFGVGLPLLCFAADPFVFADEHALLHKYKTFAYTLSITSIMAMTAWLLWGQRLGGLRPYLGGLFLTGSFISLIVGVILLPFSLLGLFFLVGFLGLTPLFSGFVFLRNGVRAINGAKLDQPTTSVYQAAILALLYSLIIPFVLNF